MSRKNSISLSLDPEDKTKLEEIAKKFNLIWGNGRGNISSLVREIAKDRLLIAEPILPKESVVVLHTQQIKAIQKAITTLISNNSYDEAQILISLLKQAKEIPDKD